ncbi:hypothetical protein LT85_3897 [Collimonas arenae]|uniref:Uncharacterized protein n=1 Tax=Collimonas arenae TaxID=279058 RepID=A0A0A1FH98_9BURK|nr:hypothetical protein LT85_3897 [Collimonas arenae]
MHSRCKDDGADAAGFFWYGIRGVACHNQFVTLSPVRRG